MLARFAPSALCDELMVVDTVACRRLEHERARRLYWEYRTQPGDGVIRVVRTIEGGHATYVDCHVAYEAEQEA